MNTLQAFSVIGLVSAARAATLQTPVNAAQHQRCDQDKNLQAAIRLLSNAVEDWLDANAKEDSNEAFRRLGQLIDTAVQEDIAIAVAEDEEFSQNPGDDVVAYGLGKKLKKWKKKAEHIAGDAAKAVAVNKVVEAATAALG